MEKRWALNPSEAPLERARSVEGKTFLMFEGIPASRYPLALGVLREVIILKSAFFKISRMQDVELLTTILLVEGTGFLGFKSDTVWSSRVESAFDLTVGWQCDECSSVKDSIKEARKRIRPFASLKADEEQKLLKSVVIMYRDTVSTLLDEVGEICRAGLSSAIKRALLQSHHLSYRDHHVDVAFTIARHVLRLVKDARSEMTREMEAQGVSEFLDDINRVSVSLNSLASALSLEIERFTPMLMLKI